ncbi:MAG: SMC family ATPase, partial [Chloroflexi bacterium]|nr:SMC family ATPase [Chloroflexota bacterium]
MIPIKLALSGFLSYRDPAELDFRGFDLACISGANGAGKSSLLDGITWALFGQARRRDDALINTQSEKAEVTFTFGYEGNVYRVQRIKPRDKTALLEFHIQSGEAGWKPLTARTLRDTEARIRATLRLDYETFVNASFFLQGKADQFTQQRAGDRKRILGSILGLEAWEGYRMAAAEQNKGINAEIGALEGRL